MEPPVRDHMNIRTMLVNFRPLSWRSPQKMARGNDLGLPFHVTDSDRLFQGCCLDKLAQLGEVLQSVDRDLVDAEPFVALSAHQSLSGKPGQGFPDNSPTHSKLLAQSGRTELLSWSQPSSQNRGT